MSRSRWLVVLTCLALLGGGTLSARAAGLDWLVLLIDRSRSIDEDELRLQRRAYTRLLNDPAVISALGAAQVRGAELLALDRVALTGLAFCGLGLALHEATFIVVS